MAQNTQHAYAQSTHTDAACAEQVAVRVAAQINTWFDIRAQIFISVEISGLEVQRGGGSFFLSGDRYPGLKRNTFPIYLERTMTASLAPVPKRVTGSLNLNRWSNQYLKKQTDQKKKRRLTCGADE